VKHQVILYVLHLHKQGIDAHTLSEITGIGYVLMHHYLRQNIRYGDVEARVVDASVDPPRCKYYLTPKCRKWAAELARNKLTTS
jgi:hypothetical protein